MLRSRREQREETLDTCAAKTGLTVAVLTALEQERMTDVGTVEEAARATRHYAMHLELDAHRLADEVRAQFGADDDDTQPIPIVAAMRKMKEPAGLWLGAGAVLGIGLLAVLGGGLGSGGSASREATGTRPAVSPSVAAAAPATKAATATLRPTGPKRPPIDLRLGAQAGKTVWVEVRRGDVSGEQVFAGIVGAGVTRRVTSAKPLWVGVAWAPNLKISLNGEPLNAEGGTESYRVTARGLERLGTG